MHDVLRERVVRKLESLPDDQLYQVLDYIEFLESRYGDQDLEREVSGLQRFAERLEDGLRRRTVSPSTIREAFQLISAADRVLSGVSSAGRQLLDELNAEEKSEEEGGPAAGRPETTERRPGGSTGGRAPGGEPAEYGPSEEGKEPDS